MTSEALLQKGNELWHEGKPEAALDCYARARAALAAVAPPTHRLDVESAYALCLHSIGDTDGALALYPALHRLCCDGNFDDTAILRQWAIAKEQAGDFPGARELYERIVPNDKSSPDDRLKWNHAIGLLDWRDGRIAEAREHLAAATALMPEDHTEASKVLAVFGNDALLSIELGDLARAYRLADRMQEIRDAAKGTTLSSELNLLRVRAALAKQRGDSAEQAKILRDGVARLEELAPKNWPYRFDLANDYVAASLGNAPFDDAIAYLSRLCDAAPEQMSWIGRFMRARLLIAADRLAEARADLIVVLASFLGSGAPASEMEIVAELAALNEKIGNGAAAIFLGKLMLKHLAEIAQGFEGSKLRQVIDAGTQVMHSTSRQLREKGRFEEALSLERLLERTLRHVVTMRGATTILVPEPVPFDEAERAAEEAWLTQRATLGQLRQAAGLEAAKIFAGQILEDLAGFQSGSGLGHKPTMSGPPGAGRLRLSIVLSGDHCLLRCVWSDRSRSERIDLSEQAFFSLVAELREAVFNPTAWQDPAARLYHHLISPIQAELSLVDSLEIDASGILGRIPFALLRDTQTCLVQQVTIRYVVDARRPDVTPLPRQGLLHCAAFDSGPLVASPIFVADTAPPLSPAAFLSGRDLTRTAMLAALRQRPALLSIAAHFDNSPSRPDLSALWLGSEEPLYLSDLGGAHFDLSGVEIALLAACSSALDDVTVEGQRSIAAVLIEKGVACFVGTLWDISESAAARFTTEFWNAFQHNSHQDPARLLTSLQARHAAEAYRAGTMTTAAGGIGERQSGIRPADWAAFAIFESSNQAQLSATFPNVSRATEPSCSQGTDQFG